ncbi:histone-lysine N-methyltransferase SUVR3 [Silene latifolia]|uniref:histone-lysine N-methyltransferase SUVR3 n=1 Tax=Silene latifolia TaxID=37657 RepID=UPI003D777A04
MRGNTEAASNQKQKQKQKQSKAQFLEIADIIIPWLTPSEVSTISSTCTTLSHLSKHTTAVRSSDASRSFEAHPIPFINTLDQHPYAFFLYTPTCLIPPLPFSRQFWGFSFTNNPNPIPHSHFTDFGGLGCHCLDNCRIGTDCHCCVLGFDGDADVVTECGPNCRCSSTCGNRVTQSGVTLKLNIVRVPNKGWGLFANQFISSAQFVCEYAGELLTTQEARRRQKLYDERAKSGHFCSALLVVREYLPSRKACFRINIDATNIGNVARFINHSCDGGNLTTVLVRSSGNVIPRVCFFTCRDVQEGEELSFRYGDVRVRPQGLPCTCGSSNCYGILPSEHT